MVTKKDVREYLAAIGSRGGRAGSRDNKRLAARVRWDRHRAKHGKHTPETLPENKSK